MSSSAILPLSVGATAPEALSLLHRRLLVAEEETEALIQDMGVLGVSRDQILGSATQRPVSPLKMRQVLRDEGMLWKQCDSLVSRMCRTESLLQTLKLTIFRLETERELDPSHTAHLKQQLAALQQEREEKQQVSRREVMRLRDQLQQAHHERDEARAEVQRMGDTVETATAAKVDVVLAAEELKIVKLEMSQKLNEMKEQMKQESARSAEAMKSHSELLRWLEETERAVEMERRQARLLQSDCQALHVEVQTGQQQLEEEKVRGRQLEEHCQQLREQTAIKDSLVSELKTELRRQQTQNSKLLKEGRELRAAAHNVQTLNKQLHSQCAQLSCALRSLTAENEKQQESLKAERSRVVKQLQEQDLLLEAARRTVQTELQVALTHKVSLQLELEKLKDEHAQLLRSSSAAQETAATQRDLLQQTIERLRRELSTAKTENDTTRKDLEGSKKELCLVVTKLEDEKRSLDTQLSEAKREVESLRFLLQSQQDESRRLTGKLTALEEQQHAVQQVEQMLKDMTEKNKLGPVEGKLKISELEGVSGPAGGVVSQTPENILASHTRLQHSGQTLQQEVEGREQELATLKTDRLQAQREIRGHQVQVEKLQRLLTSTHSKNNRALESMQRALDAARVDNERLTQSVEQAVLTNSTLHRKLEQARGHYQAAITQRDEELHKAQTKIRDLSAELAAGQAQTRGDYESSMRALQREISELKVTVKDSGSADLSKANHHLRQRVSELERQMSKQKAFIRDQKRQLRQQQKSRELPDSPHNTEKSKESIRNLQDKEDSQLPEVKMDSRQVLCKREAEWERWTSTIQRWEAKRELAHIAAPSKPVRTQLITQPR